MNHTMTRLRRMTSLRLDDGAARHDKSQVIPSLKRSEVI